MPGLKAYHRPQNVAEALRYLERPGAAILAGGTQLIPHLNEDVLEVVDLQAVGLDHILTTTDTVTFGAMTRLQTIVEHFRTPDMVRRLAHREGPNTFRNAGTIGGVVATADWESELYAALLVYEAVVTVRSSSGEWESPLSAFVGKAGELITAVTIKRAGVAAVERVVRTPADRPIVAVVGRKDKQDRIRLAACGVAQRPMRIESDALDRLDPPPDFRGSVDYRRRMTTVLAARVLEALRD